MKKHLILLICFYLILALSSICYGKKTYPLGVLTREEIIEKYFTGRTLDPIEGVWEYQPGEYYILVKLDALENQKEKHPDIDYLWIEGSSKVSNASILHKLKKTKSPFIYQADERIFFTVLSPISMIKQQTFRGNYPELWCYSRSYPQVELKTIGN